MGGGSSIGATIVAIALTAVLAGCTGSPVPTSDPFDGVWLDAEGRPVPDDEPEGEGFVLDTWVGPGHCDWGSATFLLVAWPPGRVDADFVTSDIDDGSARLFVRDPERLFDGSLLGTLDLDAELPASATATGLHRGDWEIWVTDEDEVLYVVGPDRTERWQRSPTGIWCA